MSSRAVQEGVSHALHPGLNIRWIASDKSTRISITTFQTALRLHGVDADGEEVECMVANMIYRVSNGPHV